MVMNFIEYEYKVEKIKDTFSWSQDNEICQWCNQNLRGSWRYYISHFAFEYEEDAVAFKIMWCK